MLDESRRRCAARRGNLVIAPRSPRGAARTHKSRLAAGLLPMSVLVLPQKRTSNGGVRASDDFLLERAETEGQEHLQAISSREHVGVRLSDALINRGDSQVVLSLASNTGAVL